MVTRNSVAKWLVTSEENWYKAAYYDPMKYTGLVGYWRHVTQSYNPGNNTDYTATNGANCYDGDYTVYTGYNDGALPVGTYTNVASFYGTFDQAENVWEWNDTIIGGSSRGQRGGSWDSFGTADYLRSSARSSGRVSEEAYGHDSDEVGFRLVSLAPIPEPSTYVAEMGVMALVAAMLRRRRLCGGTS